MGSNLFRFAAGRLGTIATALVACAALGLSSCGSDGEAASVTTIVLRPQSYAIKPPATPPSTAPEVPVPDGEGRTQSEQSHVVGRNEYPYTIAALYDVPLDALRKYNGWDAEYSDYPAVGGTVRIPPGAKFVDPNATTTTVAPESTDGAVTDASTPDPESCTPGSHVLEDGDYPVKVAKKYDITIEALLAANGFSMDAGGNVAQWPPTGSTVQIPAPASCTSTDSTTTTTTTAVAG